MSKTDNLMNFLKMLFLHFALSFPPPSGNLHLPQKLNKFKLLQLQALAPLV